MFIDKYSSIRGILIYLETFVTFAPNRTLLDILLIYLSIRLPILLRSNHRTRRCEQTFVPSNRLFRGSHTFKQITLPGWKGRRSEHSSRNLSIVNRDIWGIQLAAPILTFLSIAFAFRDNYICFKGRRRFFFLFCSCRLGSLRAIKPEENAIIWPGKKTGDSVKLANEVADRIA